MEVPSSLGRKIDMWRSKGRTFREGCELFGTASWVALFLGQGIVPEEQEPPAEALDPAMIADALGKMRDSYRRMAEHMPAHADFIARACPSTPPPLSAAS
jgi:tryptophan halogenase